MAEAPPPGDPTIPPPGGKPGIPGDPGSGTPGRPGEVAGPRVDVRGTVSFLDWKGGKIRINAFDSAHSEALGSQPKVLAETQIDAPGNFVLPVPQNTGSIYLEAAVDEDMDGRPGPQEPQGHADRYPIQVGTEAVEGLTVVLERRAPPPTGSKKKGDY